MDIEISLGSIHFLSISLNMYTSVCSVPYGISALGILVPKQNDMTEILGRFGSSLNTNITSC